ncbi:MAG TPA: diguanylate cyclase [Dongiaceae bacterium]|nr:diguanylate cyclase [Dongiaceae bacterium]
MTRPRKVLIAEDDKISRRLLQNTLEKAGYEVTAVEDGGAAIRLLCQSDGPRLALLDWMMPGSDGPAVVRAVRAQESTPYVHMILLTSRQSKEDIIAGLEAGADDYLVKPFNPQELRARLRTGERILQLEDTLVEAREEMRFRATHDALTQLLNRGMIMDTLKRELVRARRDPSGKGVSLVLADVDHFKKVNDSYGHAAGDEVLRQVAHRLASSVRAYDAVSRYGGEEFLIVLPGCAAQMGVERAGQMRRLIAATPVLTENGPISVTMSLGVVGTIDWPELEAEQLIHQADLALYKAKELGRNRAVLALPQGLQDIHEEVA